MKTKLLILAGMMAVAGFGCHTHHHNDHRSHRVHEPSGAYAPSHHHNYGHYDEHGVGRQYHRHYYPN